MTAKPKLSGAQRRKLAREKAIADAAITGVYVPPMPSLGALETVVDYRRELNVVYKRLRAGHMPPEVATKSAFILNLGAALARAEQELQELTQLREKVEAIQSSAAPAVAFEIPHLAAPEPARGPIDGELLAVTESAP
jgi:hypothetical protein